MNNKAQDAQQEKLHEIGNEVFAQLVYQATQYKKSIDKKNSKLEKEVLEVMEELLDLRAEYRGNEENLYNVDTKMFGSLKIRTLKTSDQLEKDAAEYAMGIIGMEKANLFAGGILELEKATFDGFIDYLKNEYKIDLRKKGRA